MFVFLIVHIDLQFYSELILLIGIRSRTKITITSSRFFRVPLGLPVRYIPEGMLLSGHSQNHLGIFHETCKVYFFTAPKVSLRTVRDHGKSRIFSTSILYMRQRMP